MKKEYDFSKGVRGKFHNGDGKFNLPIYLEPEIAEFFQNCGLRKMSTGAKSLIGF
jgi:hypothetical protein